MTARHQDESPLPVPTLGPSPWLWVPSLYFAQGLPYAVVTGVSIVMFKRMGVSNAALTSYATWLSLPWVLKPLWSPLVESLGTRRTWILGTQAVVAVGMIAVGLTLPGPGFFRLSLCMFWFLAFVAATHDIAADGFYLGALSGHQQAWFVGVRSTSFRLAAIFGQGLLLMLAGTLEGHASWRDAVIRVEGNQPGRPGPPRVSTNSSSPSPTDGGTANESTFPIAESAVASLPIDSSRGGDEILSLASIQIGQHGLTEAELEAIRSDVRGWNEKYGFVPNRGTDRPSRTLHPESGPATAVNPGQRRFRTWIEEQIRLRFGAKQPAQPPTSRVGNVAVVPLRLSRPLARDERITVQIRRTRGSRDLQLVDNDRFELSAANSQHPFLAIVQCDLKSTLPVSATLETRSGSIPWAWSITFWMIATGFLLLVGYHFVSLPHTESIGMPRDGLAQGQSRRRGGLTSFFFRAGIVRTLAFLLFYRFAEAQLTRLAQPFLLDSRDLGGLGLSTAWVGFVYGTVGVTSLTLGGLLGGFVAARNGLRAWLFPMALALNVPNLVYVYLSQQQPENPWVVSAAVGLEQFGYGFGFASYLLYMMYVSRGEHATVHYALCTGFMALGLMFPGFLTGWLQELIGYRNFFIWVMLATLPSFAVTWWIDVDPEYGRS